MIVYRCVSDREIASMMGIETYITSPHGKNTFTYEEGKNYKHFFYFYDSVVSFMDFQNMDRYHNKYSIIMTYDIDDNILTEHFGLGKYNLECVPKNLKAKLLQYFKFIYYPEFCIPEDMITKDMIIGLGPMGRITTLRRENYDRANEMIRISEKSFLEYIKWLFDNGINVQIDKVLENKDILFPIGEEKIKKYIKLY